MSLKEYFTSKINVDEITDNVIKNLKNLGKNNFSPEDEIFFDSFNNVATSVFNAEFNKLKDIPRIEALSILNSIVIKELTNYLSTKKIDRAPQSVDIATKEIVTDILVENNYYEFKKEIPNTVSIKLDKLRLHHVDYIINKSNNELYIAEYLDEVKYLIREKRVVNIPEGDYTNNSICEVLRDQLGDNYFIEFSEISKKITIKAKNRIKFNLTGLIFLNKLGFNSDCLDSDSYISDNPMRLIRNDTVTMYININKEILRTKRVILGNKIDHNINTVLFFEKPITLKSIEIEFKNYNTRGYSYYTTAYVISKEQFKPKG